MSTHVVPPPAVEADVQFAPAGGKLYIDKVTDPGGDPVDVILVNQGLKVEGRIELPGWLSGQGVVTLSASGPEDKEIGSSTFPIPGGPPVNTPPTMTYTWEVDLTTAGSLPIPLTEEKMYQLAVVFVFRTAAGGRTDIGAFYDLGGFLFM